MSLHEIGDSMTEELFVLRRKGEKDGFNFFCDFYSSGGQRLPNFLKLKHAKEMSLLEAQGLIDQHTVLSSTCEIIPLKIANFDYYVDPYGELEKVSVTQVPIGKLFRTVKDKTTYIKINNDWAIKVELACSNYIHSLKPEPCNLALFESDVVVIGEMSLYEDMQ